MDGGVRRGVQPGPADAAKVSREAGELTATPDEADPSAEGAAPQEWTVGADGLGPRTWSGESVVMPAGRLHAVSDEGLLVGVAVCQAPVVLLDPRDWRWPDDGSAEWPLCWLCLALTR